VALFAGQDQQLCVGSEHFADGILKLTACLDSRLDLLDPLIGDALGVSVSAHSEDRRPRRMALAFRKVARGFSAARVVEDQGTGGEVVRDRKLAEEFKLTLTQARGERSFGRDLHLVQIITQEK
jgi:hypothetical protein